MNIASELQSVATEVLVTLVAREDMIPTRALEELHARGDDATMRVAEALRARIASADLDHRDAWYVLLLGLAGGPRHLGLLCDVLAGTEGDNSLRSMVTDSLARIGTAGLPEIRQRLDVAPEDQRLWLYAALGWIRDAEARAILRHALRDDAELCDVVATALGTQGDDNQLLAEEHTAIRQELRAAFDSAEAWQRPELLDALHGFDRGTPGSEEAPGGAPQDEDWRLRYRIDPRFGMPLPSWAHIAALARRDPEIRATRAQLSLDPDAAPEDDASETPHCECCDQPMWKSAGVLVCRTTAVSMPILLARLLGDYRETLDSDDLFDVLDDVETGLAVALHEKPRSGRGRRRHEDEVARDGVMREMAMWMIREGVETVSAARARLLAEAGRAAQIYGDPDGFLQRSARAEPAVAAAHIGRNDPCPCGSGRKYKKCCAASSTS